MVAGHDHDLALGAEPGAELAQHRVGGRRRASSAELEHVAEQHQPVDLGKCVEQALARERLAQHVDPAAQPEMQVGDDQRAHGGAR